METQLQRFSMQAENNNAAQGQGTGNATLPRVVVTLHQYGGEFHLLPEMFTGFPSITLCNLISRWLLPDLESSQSRLGSSPSSFH